MTLKLCHFEKTFAYVDTTYRYIYTGFNYSVVIGNKASEGYQSVLTQAMTLYTIYPTCCQASQGTKVSTNLANVNYLFMDDSDATFARVNIPL